MKVLTIRGLDKELAIRIKDAAQKESLSVNQYIINLLKKNFGQMKEKKFTKRHHDLDALVGKWDEEEYHAIKNEIEAQRKIDKDLWK